MPFSSRRPWASPWLPGVMPLYAGFLYAGAMTVLLGAMLPRIAALHHLNDNQSGALLLIQFATSASGGLLVRRRFPQTLMRGFALMSAGAVVLMLAPGMLALLAIGMWGLGLGMAMTSTSLLMGSMFPESRGSALAILNFTWSVGATLCPMIVARLPGSFSLTHLCIIMFALSATFTAAFLPRARAVILPSDPRAMGEEKSGVSTVAVFAAIAFLYVGAETTIGGWMSTFASRAVLWNFSRSDWAAAWFWAALLFGRGITPLLLLWMTERRLHLFSICGTFAGVLLMVNAHSPLMLLAGAGCAGVTLAPIFPLTISLFLERAPNTTNAGWVFALAGFGGALFPWLAGVVSSRAHSLRIGLLVTLVAVTGMLLLTLQMWISEPERMKAVHCPTWR